MTDNVSKMYHNSKGPCTRSLEFLYAFLFSYSSSLLATDAKTQKIKPDLIFFLWTKVSEAVCKID